MQSELILRMDSSLIVFCLLLVSAVEKVSLSASLVEYNETMVAKVGDSALLTCPGLSKDADGSIYPIWSHHPQDSSGFSFNEREVYDRARGISERYRGRFHEITDPVGDVSTLNVTNITSIDSGRFECKDENTDANMSSTQLIVIDGDPQCSSTEKTVFPAKNKNCGESKTVKNVQLSCTVTYRGSLNSGECLLEWRTVGKKDRLNATCTNNISTVISTLTLDTESHRNGTSYICVVRRTSEDARYNCKTDAIVLSPGTGTVCGKTHLVTDLKKTQRDATSPDPRPVSNNAPDTGAPLTGSASSLTNSRCWTSLSVLLLTLAAFLHIYSL